MLTDRGLPIIKVHTSSLFRAAAKELERHKLAQVFDDKFSVSGEVRDRSVLIVDDVIRSGTSMAAVGKAGRLDLPSPQVTGERLVSFLVSFMFVYLRPSPSTTAL